MRSVPFLVMLLATVGRVSLPAQVIQPGDTLRLNGIQASVVTHRGDSLEVRFDRVTTAYSVRREARKLGYSLSDSTTTLAIRSVRTIEVLRGTRNAGREGAGIGAGLGFLAGWLIGYYEPDCEPEPWFGKMIDFCGLDWSGFGNGLLVGLGGSAVVGAIGYLVGRQITKDNWVTVGAAELAPAVLPGPHGVGVGILVRF